ncbi:uncharacterized protein KQ657_004737 [Scheffersomyces spartinae]|uniref:THIF-type NAD/FAD binding fold domain-containing protein n=1 Tax=Scheffersomyces spartinae TaxID=45513 RepID=A0A9P8AJW5_9ASCO|nr:uncharacterized protein KQ657_004737 [Scheffersomyces spartinae]KAG7194522.1 hypothetical protein KQ657_004737 [Scheffersomyces spartinae]
MGRDTWLTVVSTAVATVGIIECLRYFYHQQKQQGRQPSLDANQGSRHSEELIQEQLARNYAFLSAEGMSKVREQHIVVVGAGGVGSWTATMLVRSGVSKIRIIDFDQVSLSSLNRHAVATLADVGTSKVECLKQHLLKIAPWCDIDACNQLWSLETSEQLIFGDDFKPTFVVDCIDNIDTKVDLLHYCHENKVPVISSGGAACKSDPTRINIADISKTEEDPLARSVRIKLGKKGITRGIPVVFSAEKPDPRKAKLLPLDEEELAKGDVDQLSALRNFRVRILPVLGTMPGVFGLTIATYILTVISGYPIEPVEGKNRLKIYDSVYQSLSGQEARLGNLDNRVPIALREVPYIIDEVFRGKSPISGFSTRLTLSRWNPDKPLSFQNIVVMTKDEQKTHEERVLKGGERLEDVYSAEVIERVKGRFKDEEYFSQFR